MLGEHGRAAGRNPEDNALPGDRAPEDNALPGRLDGRSPEDNVLPGTPMVIDILTPHSLLPNVSRAGTRDVRMSDGNYVYMMTSQRHAVQLHEAVAVWQRDNHTPALPGGASMRGHGEQQEAYENRGGQQQGTHEGQEGWQQEHHDEHGERNGWEEGCEDADAEQWDEDAEWLDGGWDDDGGGAAEW